MNFAVVVNGVVVNVIAAESKEVAEEVTGKTCIEYTDANPAYINGTYDGSVFITPKPYASWVLDGNTKQWKAPTPMPTTEGKFYDWSEDSVSWVEVSTEMAEKSRPQS